MNEDKLVLPIQNNQLSFPRNNHYYLRSNTRLKIGEVFFSEKELKESECFSLQDEIDNVRNSKHISTGRNIRKNKLSREYLDELTELLSHKETKYSEKRKQLNEEYNQGTFNQRRNNNDILEIQQDLHILPSNLTEEDIGEEREGNKGFDNIQSELSKDNQNELWTKLDKHIATATAVHPKIKTMTKKKNNLSQMNYNRNDTRDYLPSLIGIRTISKNSSILTKINNQKKPDLSISNNYIFPMIKDEKQSKVKELQIAKVERNRKYKENQRLMNMLSSHVNELRVLKQRCITIQTENAKIKDSIPPISNVINISKISSRSLKYVI